MPDPISELNRLASMEAFRDAFSSLQEVDSENGAAIEISLRAALEDSHKGLLESVNNPERVRYWLLREEVELKAQASPYLNYEREMAQREAALWRFAFEQNETFFGLVFNALDRYFAGKTDCVIRDVETDASWYTGLRDNAKKTGLIVKHGARLLKRGVDRIRKSTRGRKDVDDVLKRTSDVIGGAAEIDVRDIVRKTVETHLSEEVLRSDFGSILKEAGERYEQAWLRQIKAETPDLDQLRAFSRDGPAMPGISSSADFGLAEQTLAVGLGGALVGTFALAAGWHVLAYSLVYVFYPVAIVTILATIGIAVWRKDQELEKHRESVREIVDQYHRHFVLQVDMARLTELGGKTLREAMAEKAKQVVLSTVERWEQAIGGELRAEHYRILGSACATHLELIQRCLDQLPTDQERSLPGTSTEK